MSSLGPGTPNYPGNKNGEESAQVAYLNQALWRSFTEATSPEDFSKAWLALQVSMLARVSRGVVVLGQAEQGPFVPAAVWPEGDSMPATLSRAAESAMAERKGVAQKQDTGDQTSHLAYPLLVDDQLFGVVAFEFTDHNDIELQSMMRQLQWGCGWLEAFLRKLEQGGSVAGNKQLSRLLELTATALEHKKFRAAAMAIVTELAIQTGCDRVSLGFRRGNHTKVYALSHNAQFGEQSNLVRAITEAMDEATDQLGSIVYPPPEDGHLVTQAHARLAETGGSSCICSVLITSNDDILGALSFERDGENPFDQETVDTLENAAALLGPLLEIKRRDDRMLPTKVADSVVGFLKKLVGPRHDGLKLTSLILIGLFVFLSSTQGDYRVTADAVLEGEVQRAIVAPINGYIREAQTKAGDKVDQGDLLFSIDDRDLRLEFVKWSSQKEQIDRRYRDALAAKNRSEVNIFKAQLEQAEAQLELLKEQIARTQVTAPFNGILISGDLSQKLGSPVSRGEVLLNIAPLDSYRVVLHVDERNISDMAVGQTGQLVLTSLPEQQFPFEIERITPPDTQREVLLIETFQHLIAANEPLCEKAITN